MKKKFILRTQYGCYWQYNKKLRLMLFKLYKYPLCHRLQIFIYALNVLLEHHISFEIINSWNLLWWDFALFMERLWFISIWPIWRVSFDTFSNCAFLHFVCHFDYHIKIAPHFFFFCICNGLTINGLLL